MASLREMLLGVLTGDATLTGLISSANIYDSDSLPRDGMSFEQAPKLADGVRIAPHMKLRYRDSTGFAPRSIAPERQSLEVYVYQDTGFGTVEAALLRCKALLHDEYFNVDDRAFVHVLFAFRSGEMYADEYKLASMMFARFTITQIL